MMLHCIPQSVFSWDYQIEGASAGPAGVSLNFFTEQGGVTLGPSRFAVRKHGWLSGQWSLEAGSQVFAEAEKPNPLTRRFILTATEGQFCLEAQSMFTRAFSISSRGEELGVIQPEGFLTRRASISCHPSVPEPLQLFAFWLVVLTWRRSSESSANAAPAS